MPAVSIFLGDCMDFIVEIFSKFKDIPYIEYVIASLAFFSLTLLIENYEKGR